ncbi:MAG: hypothetical protein K0S74_130 [Chlamydiales bacterium]|jgi:hypothetical protein|nr:hypothetical protein [Chlamydiales bacterium]
MNTKELVDYIYDNISFIDQHAPELYQQVNMTRNIVIGLCLHPNPYQIPKHRRRFLYQLQQLIDGKKQAILGGTDELINEKIIQIQKTNHKRMHTFNLRKRWMPI